MTLDDFTGGALGSVAPDNWAPCAGCKSICYAPRGRARRCLVCSVEPLCPGCIAQHAWCEWSAEDVREELSK